MNLPEDVRLKIEKRSDKDEILRAIELLQRDGISITNDVYAAIVPTLQLMDGATE